ncbi:hypothetical protein [Shewanella glacialimarina]|uniref:hypothetical protein n=1 Tax=Shewanella glacialimarina TaxID=2590884 RepID=UPI001CF92625|nr:hypothetical protein [Shewanella glacialimarina]UCX05431.1 hypothetical protein FJ709_13600 [Shewanella glacialimarina]
MFRIFRDSFDIKKPLLNNGYFWCVFIGTLSIALVLAALISHTNNLNYYPSLTKAALDNFFTYQKIPLTVFSLIFPLIGLVVATHRSALTIKQMQTTDEQIQATKVQNTFANYYKHREEFFKLLDVLEQKFNVVFYERNKFYKELYPLNGQAYLDVKSDPDKGGVMCFRSEIKELVSNTVKSMVKLEMMENNPKITTGKGNSSALENFYIELINKCEKYLNFKPIKVSDEDTSNVKWIPLNIKNIRQWDIGIPVKDNNPLHFYDDVCSIFDELLVFTYLSEKLDHLSYFGHGAWSQVEKQYSILIDSSN